VRGSLKESEQTRQECPICSEVHAQIVKEANSIINFQAAGAESAGEAVCFPITKSADRRDATRSANFSGVIPSEGEGSLSFSAAPRLNCDSERSLDFTRHDGACSDVKTR